jgi:hypothetical protein
MGYSIGSITAHITSRNIVSYWDSPPYLLMYKCEKVLRVHRPNVKELSCLFSLIRKSLSLYVCQRARRGN